MARALAKSTGIDSGDASKKTAAAAKMIADIGAERKMRLTETSSDRSPDPNTAEGGSRVRDGEGTVHSRDTRDILSKVEESLRFASTEGPTASVTCAARRFLLPS